jgi:hypothetical protein
MEDSGFGRIASVLWAPGKTFASIAARPTWWQALLLLTVLGVVSVYVGFTKVDPSEITRQLEEQGRPMPPNMTEETLYEISKWTAVVGAAVVAPVVYFGAAFLWWLGLRLLGSETDYRRSLSVAVHGFMPFALPALIGIVVALGRSSVSMEELQSGQLVASNLGVLASEETSKVALALLTSVDLFSIWCIALLTLGYQVVARVSRGTALGVVLTVWLLAVAIKVGFTAAFA